MIPILFSYPAVFSLFGEARLLLYCMFFVAAVFTVVPLSWLILRPFSSSPAVRHLRIVRRGRAPLVRKRAA